MPSYYMNVELEGWQRQLDNYNQETAAWEHNAAAREAEWQEAHDLWAVTSEGPEPVQPEPPAPPERPVPVVTVYEARDVTEVEELETAAGVALVLPGRIVMTGNGSSFAVSEDELAAFYQDTTTVTL